MVSIAFVQGALKCASARKRQQSALFQMSPTILAKLFMAQLWPVMGHSIFLSSNWFETQHIVNSHAL